ncbi:NADH:flavin oxidoreductase/NADH oxidase [Colletotrichum tofieldiae]|nr:NADH:flavin oxidoreductase/NADH oxidase [Colletotrichum tofieldiae]
MTKEDTRSVVADFAQTVRNAIEISFDGVELHGANIYLIDQFIQDRANKRADDYGGSIENRARSIIEAASAVVAAIGADRVGIRFSPCSTFQGMRMKDPIPQFTQVI